MATTWPTVCQVLYETEPSPRRHDDDPFIPYRFSLLKSSGSTNSHQQLRGRHARHHDNATQASDRHGYALDAGNRHGNKDRDKKSYQQQVKIKYLTTALRMGYFAPPNRTLKPRHWARDDNKTNNFF